MTILITDLRDVGIGLASRVRSGVAALRRTTPAVVLLRLLIVGPLAVAWTLFPAASPLVLVVGVGLALAAALFPRTRAVGVALLTTAGMWLVTTTFLNASVPLVHVLFLAAALYVAHTAAALAAVLPHDTAVAPAVLGRWALRTLSVLVVSVGLSVAALFVAAWLPPQQSLVAPVLGALVAIGLAALIAWLVRRRSS